MIRLNLLPYRERQQAAHRRHFRQLFLGVLLSCLFGIGSIALTLGQRITSQEEHNQRQEDAINALNKTLRHHVIVRNTTTALREQNSQLKRLTHNREQAAMLLDQLSASTPAGVYLEELKPSSGGYTINGLAQSFTHVSAYLQLLATSGLFTHPTLIEFNQAPTADRRGSKFIISLETTLD